MTDIQKIDHLTKRCSDLFSEMKRHERESIKNKKRGDQLQKDKDNTRNELNKTTSLKEKLEKLCRELQKENNKLKVRLAFSDLVWWLGMLTTTDRNRTKTRLFPTRRLEARTHGMKGILVCSGGWTTTRTRRTTRENRLSRLRQKICL